MEKYPMFRTSYFSNVKNASGTMSLIPKPPMWFIGLVAEDLAPDLDLWNAWKKKKLSDDEFVETYRNDILGCLDAYEMLKKYDGKILLGTYRNYYLNTDVRHIVREWVRSETGIVVPELTDNEARAIRGI